MKYIIGLIEKDKLLESLVEKLCLRFRATRTERQWRDISYCLSLFPYRYGNLVTTFGRMSLTNPLAVTAQWRNCRRTLVVGLTSSMTTMFTIASSRSSLEWRKVAVSGWQRTAGPRPNSCSRSWRAKLRRRDRRWGNYLLFCFLSRWLLGRYWPHSWEECPSCQGGEEERRWEDKGTFRVASIN